MSDDTKKEFDILNTVYDYWRSIHNSSKKLKDGKIYCSLSRGEALDIPIENDSQYTSGSTIDPNLLEYSLKDIKKSHLIQIAQGRIISDEELYNLAISYMDLAPFVLYEFKKDYEEDGFSSEKIHRMSEEKDIDKKLAIGLEGTKGLDIIKLSEVLYKQIYTFHKSYPKSKYFNHLPSNEQNTVINDKSSDKSIYEVVKSECLYLIVSSPPKSNFIMNGLSYVVDFSAAIALFFFIIFPLIYFSEERATISDIYPILGILISVYVVKKIFGFKL